MRKFFFISLFLLLTLEGCKKHENSGKSNVTLSGMSGTFPLSFYNILFSNYADLTNNTIIENAQSSGASVRTFQDKVVDFAGTDALLSKEKFSELEGEVLTIPTCLGAIVITYNIPGVSDLKLTGPILAEIYLKNINYWDDTAIQSINPKINLPHKLITTIHRADGSGISYVLSDYLSKISPKWEKEMGTGKSLNWKNGIAVKSCLKIAEVVSNIEGAIGYTGWEEASVFNLSTAHIRNAQGDYINVSIESILAAANRDYPDDMRVMITNSPNKNAYPISCFSWLVVYKNQTYTNHNKQKFETLISFLRYIVEPETQKLAGKMHYAPLPPNVIEKAKVLINTMEWKE